MHITYIKCTMETPDSFAQNKNNLDKINKVAFFCGWEGDPITRKTVFGELTLSQKRFDLTGSALKSNILYNYIQKHYANFFETKIQRKKKNLSEENNINQNKTRRSFNGKVKRHNNLIRMR